MQETEGLLTEDVYEFFLFLDTLLVKDTTKFVECVCSISAEGRDVLYRILTDVDPGATAAFVVLSGLPLVGYARESF